MRTARFIWVWVLISLANPLSGQPPLWQKQADKPQIKVVFVTRTGKRYHRDTCRYLISRIETTERKALAAGFTPCGHCKPGGKASGTSETQKQTNTANRCRGITQKGKRCKRKASANGYCWQHP